MLSRLPASHPDCRAVLTQIVARHQPINLLASPIRASLTREFVGLAVEHRLPTIYQWREQVESGGLLSYGPDLASMWRQAKAEGENGQVLTS